MFKVIRYFVLDGRGGRDGPYRERDEAETRADAVARRGLSAKVFSVTGEPVFDLWEEPRLVAAYPANGA